MDGGMRRRDVLRAALGAVSGFAVTGLRPWGKVFGGVHASAARPAGDAGFSRPARVLVFPEDAPVGWLQLVTADGRDIGRSVRAVGTVDVPNGAMVELMMLDEGAARASWLRTLDADDLHGFYGWFSHGSFDLGHLGRVSGLRRLDFASAYGLELVGEPAACWRRLRALTYVNLVNVTLPEGTVRALSRLPLLREAYLDHCALADSDRAMLNSSGRPSVFHVLDHDAPEIAEPAAVAGRPVPF